MAEPRSSEPRLLPMFPLGTVLFPHALLPLRVFEPRYRTMTAHVMRGDAEFGVVLIERGSEVGGGDIRFDVGTGGSNLTWQISSGVGYRVGPLDVSLIYRYLSFEQDKSAVVQHLDIKGPMLMANFTF